MDQCRIDLDLVFLCVYAGISPSFAPLKSCREFPVGGRPGSFVGSRGEIAPYPASSSRLLTVPCPGVTGRSEMLESILLGHKG